MAVENIVKNLQSVDNRLTDEFPDHVEKIKQLDRGKNEGITESFYKTNFDLMDLQYITLVNHIRHG